MGVDEKDDRVGIRKVKGDKNRRMRSEDVFSLLRNSLHLPILILILRRIFASIIFISFELLLALLTYHHIFIVSLPVHLVVQHYLIQVLLCLRYHLSIIILTFGSNGGFIFFLYNLPQSIPLIHLCFFNYFIPFLPPNLFFGS